MKVIAILIFIGAAALGFYEGRKRSPTLIVVISGITILGISNLAASWPWFTGDPSTWTRTYSSGLLHAGMVLFIVHVLPFILTAA